MRPSTRLLNILLVVITTLVSLAALEVMIRIQQGMPVLTLRDWRGLNAAILHGSSAHDDLVGWVQVPDIASNGFNTIEHGIRKNSGHDEAIDQGAILAVGDSFTAGSEVRDQESWPAQLERDTGLRVLNAGVGGYGVDQATLRAEQLLPLARPRLVLVGILSDDVLRASYRVYNAPKPYFAPNPGGTPAQTTWSLQNVPVPKETPRHQDRWWKSMLARSLVVHLVLSRDRFRDFWFTGVGPVYERAHADGAGASCAALARLSGVLRRDGVKGLIVAQYGGDVFRDKRDRPPHMQQVIACATAQGFGIVDEFESLKAVAANSIDDLKKHYVMHGNGAVYGHMSPLGNALIARLIGEELKRQPALVADVPSVVRQALAPGNNRLSVRRPERFHRANTFLDVVPETGAITGAPVMRLSSTPVAGEQYIIGGWSALEPGPFTFSVYVREAPDLPIRLQLLDSGSNGVIADLAPGKTEAALSLAGSARDPAFRATREPGGWMRLALSADLPGGQGNIFIQLTHQQRGANASPVSLLFQAPMVELGRTASPWCPPGQCTKQN